MNAEQAKNKPAPAHECAEEIARALWAEYAKIQGTDCTEWDNLAPWQRVGWKAAAKAAPRVIIEHAGDDLKAWLAARIGNSSIWHRLFSSVATASVGALILWIISFFASCSTITPEQVLQWDATHAAMHAATGTTCTLCIPVTVTPSDK